MHATDASRSVIGRTVFCSWEASVKLEVNRYLPFGLKETPGRVLSSFFGRVIAPIALKHRKTENFWQTVAW